MAITEQSRYLAFLADRGVQRRYAHKGADYIETVVVPRVREELRIINKMGFAEYFLILEDITTYCRSNDIALGPARGSAGGSVVSYCLGITEIDPLQFDLIFERFLNDERFSPPDIDTDVCWSRRQDVIDYIVSKYGEEHVAQIVTFGTLGLKSLLDDLGRVYGVPIKDIERVKKAVVEDGDKMTLAKALENEGFREEFEILCEQEPRILEGMQKLEGLHRHGSIHAGGVIVASEPINTLAPTYLAKGKGRPVVQYDMVDAEQVGLLKMDLLGLRTVTLIDWAEKDVRKWHDPNFYTRGYRLDDQEAFNIINRGDTAGIFQLEGTGITRFAQQMKVESFNDIIALLALYRPGTLDSGSADQYIKRKNGEEEVTYPHPSLEPILKDTYGIIVYQEQVMSIFRTMGGYTLGQADMARKAMGKKKKEIMDAELDKFREGARNLGYDEDTIEDVAHLIETFARYGFNKSHAVAYAFLTYWTAILKARYPDCFYTAWLNVTDDGDKQGWIIDLATRAGVEILPPNINLSQGQFAVTKINEIRFGLRAIKGMGQSFVVKTLNSREANGEFKSYYDYCHRLPGIPVDKKEAMIGAGAFDFDPHHHRAELLHNARIMNLYAKDNKEYKHLIQTNIPELKPLEMGELEKEYINFYITANPIKNIQNELKMMGVDLGIKTGDLRGKPLVGGKITNVHKLRTKKGDEMAFVAIDDGIVSHSITMFPSIWKKFSNTMATDEVFAFRCELGEYRGETTLQAYTAFPIDIKNRDVTVVIDVGTPTPMDIARLKMILDSTDKGNSMIKIKMLQNGYQFVLKSELYKINATDDKLDEIREIFGSNSIKLERN